MNPLSHFPMDQIQAMQGQAPMQTPQGLTPQFGPALPEQPQQMSLSQRPMRRADKLRLKIDAAGAKQDVTTSMSYIQNQIALSQAREQAINEEIQRIQGTLMGGQIPKPQDPQFSQNQLYATGINYLLGGNIGQTATYFNQGNQKHAEQDYQRRLAQYQQERDMLDMQLKQKYGVSQDERNYQQQLGGMQIQEYGRQQQNAQDLLKEARGRFYSANTLGEKIQAMSDMGMQPGSPVWNAEIQKFNSEDEKRQRAAVGDDVKDFYKYTDQFKAYGGIPDAAMPHAVALWRAMQQKWGDRWNVPDPSSFQGLKTVAQQNADTNAMRVSSAIEMAWNTLDEKAREFNATLPLKAKALDIAAANLKVAQANLSLRGIGMVQGDSWKQYKAAEDAYDKAIGGFNGKDIGTLTRLANTYEESIKKVEKEMLLTQTPTPDQMAYYASLKQNLKAVRETISEVTLGGNSVTAVPGKNPYGPLGVKPPSDMSGPIGDAVGRGMGGGQRSATKKGGGQPNRNQPKGTHRAPNGGWEFLPDKPSR